ncbi:MAG: SCO1664 family protein [Chloroflexi bacterium]|nr:SCO1664 family protein [Chloroflexota bacterium]
MVAIGALVNGWSSDDAHVLAALREAKFGPLRLIYDSSNYVFLADLTHAAYGAGLGVYKPAAGEQPLHDFPDGTLHVRELAAYELARALGWSIVPPTVVRDGPQGPGSLQLFIEHDPACHYFALRGDAAYREQLMRFAAFDLVANNADRKGGHLLLDARARLWGIDNGLCFHRVDKLRTVVWDFAGSVLPEPLVVDIERVRAGLAAGDAATAALRACLRRDEVDALQRRCAALVAHPVLPEMYPWRCVPWPLI